MVSDDQKKPNTPRELFGKQVRFEHPNDSRQTVKGMVLGKTKRNTATLEVLDERGAVWEVHWLLCKPV